jgi:hypothetical protein
MSIWSNSPAPVVDVAPLDQVGWLAEQPKALQGWAKRHGRWRR